MLRTLYTLLAIQTSSMINVLVYYVRKLPLVRKLITSNFYANHKTKKRIAALVWIFIILGRFMLSTAYVGLLLYLPVVQLGEALSEETQLHQFIHLFFLISFVVSGVSSATMLEPKRGKYIAIKLLRMSPVRYMKTILSYKYVMYFVYLLPALLWFGSTLGGSMTQLVLLTVAATLWRVLWEYLHLKLFEKTNIILIKKTAIVWLVVIVGYAVAYLPLVFQSIPIAGSILYSFPTMIVIIAAGLFAAIQLARYPGYRAVVDNATKRDDPLLNIGQMVTDANKTSVSSKDSDYLSSLNDSDKHKSKEGYAYLNALFFARHRSLINRPLNIRLAIIGILGVVGVIGTLMFEQMAVFLSTNLGVLFPILVLTMLYLSVGEKMCKAIFYNCDLSLIRYTFYRKASIQHFRIRLYKVMGQNISIGATLGAVLTLIFLIAGGEIFSQDVFMIWICILTLSIFFSIHHLFMYYIFQPYTTELNVKNPYFQIVNIVVGIASGLSLFIRVPSNIFTLIVFTFTLLYFIITLNLIGKYGSRTFRVK